jgi:hypothetical protein
MLLGRQNGELTRGTAGRACNASERVVDLATLMDSRILALLAILFAVMWITWGLETAIIATAVSFVLSLFVVRFTKN